MRFSTSKRARKAEPARKIFLDVPYERKDEAKLLGAMWDASKRCWFSWNTNGNLNDLFKKFNQFT